MSIGIEYTRSDGKRLVLGDEIFYIMKDGLKGIDRLKPEVYKEKRAIGDGDIVTGSRIPSREIICTAELHDAAQNEQMRQKLNRFFVPRFTFDLKIMYINESRCAKGCYLLDYQCPTKNIYYPIKPSVTMLYPDGYFLSVDDFGKNIAEIEPRLGYPFVSVASVGRIYGIFAFAENVMLDNDGDAEAFCKAVIRARGEITNPKLVVGNGYIRLLKTLSSGDVVMIDSQNKSVLLNGQNAVTLLDRSSNFNGIVFAPGMNTVGFTADVGSNLMDVWIYYNKRYAGV